MIVRLIVRDARCQRPASAASRSSAAISFDSAAKRWRMSRSLPIVFASSTPVTERDSSTSVVSRAIRQVRPRASARRLVPSRSVNSRNSGTTTSESRASCQSITTSATAMATVVVPFCTTDPAVVVITLSTPPMSLNTRDSTSPVFVRVKKPSDIRCSRP